MKKPIQNNLKVGILDGDVHYHLLFEQSHFAIQVITLDGQVLYVNKAYEKLWGVTLSDLSKYNIFHDEQLRSLGIMSYIERAFKGESLSFPPFECNSIKMNPKKKGRKCWIQSHIYAVRGINREIHSVVMIQEDITNRKHTEEVLRESHEELNRLNSMFRLMSDNLPELIWTKDLQGRYMFANKSCCENLLSARDVYEPIGKTDIFFAERQKQLYPENPNYYTFGGTCSDSDRAVLETKNGIRGDESGYIKGKFVILDVSKSPLMDENGKIIGTVGCGRNVTDEREIENKRKQVEDALRESEKKMCTILDSMPDVVLQLDTDMIILWANKATLKMKPDAIGKLCYYALHGRKQLCPGCPIVKALKTGKIEKGIVHFDSVEGVGESYWDDIGVPIKDANKEVISIVKIARNITDIKKAEVEKEEMKDQYRQVQKMESVGQLAGGVAHDFNNMLGVILGYTELALNKLDQNKPVFEDLQEIRKAANRSVSLTRQLLAFARRQIVSPKVLDLNENVEGMLKMLYRLIGEDIDLVWLPYSGLWPVNVDPAQIDQILANLCVNARDAIAGVGKMTIETGNVSFDKAFCVQYSGFIQGEFVQISVSDDGCGMDKETQNKIFEPFFTTKSMRQGTGLGLSTVYGIVKQNNGFISVYSEPGKGTTLKISLPRYIGEIEKMQKKYPVEQIRCGKETILLVEDEQDILKMITMMLELHGYTVLTANTPKEAIHIAGDYSSNIHLLLTDVIMPEMNGRDLAENMISIYKNLKCLYMSGYTANLIAHRSTLDAGVNFIQKPFTMQDLIVKVSKVLDSN